MPAVSAVHASAATITTDSKTVWLPPSLRGQRQAASSSAGPSPTMINAASARDQGQIGEDQTVGAGDDAHQQHRGSEVHRQ